MNWNIYRKGFKQHLLLEKSLSNNTITAYLNDILKLEKHFLTDKISHPKEFEYKHLLDFVVEINKIGVAATSQARIISGIRAFFNYLLLENEIQDNPALHLELPKLARKLPSVLSVHEIDLILNQIDMTKTMAHRDKAMVETLFSCGLRVSELSSLLVSQINFEEFYVKVTGKGNKERFVPIGSYATKAILNYFEDERNHLKIHPQHTDFVFLNVKGKKISRISIFKLVKKLASKAEIFKNISPHTFRHSFATALVDGGADLRAVQQMLGHESITTTEIYTHLDRSYLKSTIELFHPRAKSKKSIKNSL